MRIVIWWLRRDLRLSDNPALHAAIKNGERVIPCFILDPLLLNGPKTSSKRRDFLLNGLAALDAELRRRGSYLVIRYGDPLTELGRLLNETGAQAIYAEADFSPFARRRDGRIAAVLPLHLVGGPTLRHPKEMLKPDGTPYTVFTPFKKAWLQQPLPTPADLLPAPKRIITPSGISSLSLPAIKTSAIFPPGELEAQRRLERFLSDGIAEYAEKRDRLDIEATSGLSPYLRFGMLSVQQAVVSALRSLQEGAGKGAETWLSELIWREFYVSILYHFPQVLKRNFRREYDGIPWLNKSEDFAAWKSGQTGYPVVDAAMRQLAATGWMHNRARMIVASFLVKDLLIDWRWGEAWFMQQLVDGDPAANNGGWQWTAGVGTDAAPYFRIFNPVMQSMKFDPQGRFIRRWVPELQNVPDEYIHEPWKMPLHVQHRAGCRLGRDYPLPIVDHEMARQRVLQAFSQAQRAVGRS
ncbi:MAG: deoxyribodipyrimidine photo-lyase [Anaerolineales bacterium]